MPLTQAAISKIPDGVRPSILFNPGLETTTVMVPSLIGFIMLFVGVVITSLGVVREREQGTLEQLAVMPLRPWDVMAGKIVPYFVIALFDIILVTLGGLLLFDVPFNGSVLLFAAFVFVFLFVVLGLGVAILTVSKSQGEAIQLAIMVLMPQIMLSGMIFPLESMATVIRWIGYMLPLTWFANGMRGIFLRGSDAGALAGSLAVLIDHAAIGQFGDRIAGSMSGGERRKLGGCMALLHEPELLVLDEVTTGVDPLSRMELWRLITGAAWGCFST